MTRMRTVHVWMRQAIWFLPVAVVACGRAPEPEASSLATPVYNEETGRLEQIVSDRDGDGRVETRAFMDGTRLVRIEIDRDGDQKVDRWEYYSPGGDPKAPVIERVEEADGPEGVITRRERYTGGVLERVEDDTNFDGRPDKWETYREGRLVYVDLDLSGRGTPNRRLVYGTDGTIVRTESDADGSGTFDALEAPGGNR